MLNLYDNMNHYDLEFDKLAAWAVEMCSTDEYFDISIFVHCILLDKGKKLKEHDVVLHEANLLADLCEANVERLKDRPDYLMARMNQACWTLRDSMRPLSFTYVTFSIRSCPASTVYYPEIILRTSSSPLTLSMRISS